MANNPYKPGSGAWSNLEREEAQRGTSTGSSENTNELFRIQEERRQQEREAERQKERMAERERETQRQLTELERQRSAAEPGKAPDLPPGGTAPGPPERTKKKGRRTGKDFVVGLSAGVATFAYLTTQGLAQAEPAAFVGLTIVIAAIYLWRVALAASMLVGIAMVLFPMMDSKVSAPSIRKAPARVDSATPLYTIKQFGYVDSFKLIRGEGSLLVRRSARDGGFSWLALLQGRLRSYNTCSATWIDEYEAATGRSLHSAKLDDVCVDDFGADSDSIAINDRNEIVTISQRDWRQTSKVYVSEVSLQRSSAKQVDGLILARAKYDLAVYLIDLGTGKVRKTYTYSGDLEGNHVAFYQYELASAEKSEDGRLVVARARSLYAVKGKTLPDYLLKWDAETSAFLGVDAIGIYPKILEGEAKSEHIVIVTQYPEIKLVSKLSNKTLLNLSNYSTVVISTDGKYAYACCKEDKSLIVPRVTISAWVLPNEH